MTTSYEEPRSPMYRATMDLCCDFCGVDAPVAEAKIAPKKAGTRTFHRFTTASICLSCARNAVALLETT
jgi:hypothetical protein